MGDHTYFTVLLLCSIICSFVCPESFGFESCPDKIRSVCQCFYPYFTVRCSQKELKEYPDLTTIQGAIQKLDVTFNALQSFPPYLYEFDSLEILDLSHNQIEFLSSDVVLPKSLITLTLSYNNISNWLSITSNLFLGAAPNLETLNLAGNPLGAFNGGSDERTRMISNSLKTLDLSNCQINKIIGPQMVSGLVSLEHLILKSNPLHSLPNLYAGKLLSLDLSSCNLTTLRRTFFSEMPSLTSVNFSENHRLSLIHRNDEFVESISLRDIDLSKCNMNAVELDGFPNIISVNLNGNLITALHDETFQNNILIENLDLSSNAISRISSMAFKPLTKLRNIDLSLNMIRHIDRNTFNFNQQLMSINLSRNFIDRFWHFVSASLAYLNMSRCEITKIDGDALKDLPELIELDLSYNWFNEFPTTLKSPLLQILDLSKCRLSHIGNMTFAALPELSKLNLAGNRLTTTFRTDYFAHNQYLNEIWLGDNPWHCECDKNSLDFYKYITERPSRIKDLSQFRCYSSGNTNGVYWEVACSKEWDINIKKATLVEKIWTMTMAILVIITILYSTIYGLRWWSQYRKEVREEQQRQENLDSQRELMRHNQMVLDQEGQLNAPDPRESNPPCYADAIRMPRLDTSFISLKREIFTSSDSVNSIRRGAKRSRCRSEEVLSINGTRRHILTARSRKNTLRPWDANQAHSSVSMADIIRIVPNDSDQRSFEIIAQLETEDGHSPYAKRRPQTNTTSSNQHGSISSDSLNQRNQRDQIPNNFSSEDNLDTSESSQASQPLFTSNEALDSTSSSSSFSSIDPKNYSRFKQNWYSLQHSDV